MRITTEVIHQKYSISALTAMIGALCSASLLSWGTVRFPRRALALAPSAYVAVIALAAYRAPVRHSAR
jgi:hypothetical protein